MAQTTPEINGKPAAFITVAAEEKINIGNFSNVTISASVGRYVEDESAIIDAELRETLHNHCEKLLAEEREEVLKSLGGE